MLAVKRSAGVVPEVNVRSIVQARKCASEKSTLALKSRADVIRSPKQENQWPHKRTYVHQFKKKKFRNQFQGWTRRCGWRMGWEKETHWSTVISDFVWKPIKTNRIWTCWIQVHNPQQKVEFHDNSRVCSCLYIVSYQLMFQVNPQRSRPSLLHRNRYEIS